jgi:two-component system nitrogen regulation sensor histidine kinase NtrY
VGKPAPIRPEPPRRASRGAIAAIIVATLVVFAAVFSQSWFNLPFLRPNSSQQALVLTAFSAIIFLLLLALTFVLARNLVKLYAERRLGVLGSKFRTRLVIGALVLSFTPVIFFCFFAYGLLNRTIVHAYSLPFEQIQQNTTRVADMMEHHALANAAAEAQSIAELPETARSFQTGNFSAVAAEFRRHETTLQGGFALALLRGADSPTDPRSSASSWNYTAEASFHAPAAWPLLRGKLPADRDKPFDLDGTAYALGMAAAGDRGLIVVGMPLPAQYKQTLTNLETNSAWYADVARQLRQLRQTYIGILLLVTVLILFAATWMALFVSKLVTRPVAALAEATEEISRGRLDYRVEVRAADELGDLVAKFNSMAGELEFNRHQLENSSRELAQRREQIETILENIPTGVLSLDGECRVAHANNAFRRAFLGKDSPLLAPGAALSDLFPRETLKDLEHLFRKADRMGSAIAQMDIPLHRRTLNAAVTVASIGRQRGYVVVIEDLSDVVKAQKQAAWREVARRVAHEIKNPLTPIALSAQRIKRHLGRADTGSQEVIETCAETIAVSVESMRTLVDEFAALARFPTAQPQPSNINGIIESALAMFDGRLDGISLRTYFSPDLPRVMADPEGVKRAVANLIDNAAEAMRGSLVREIQISTSLLEQRDMVEIVIADSGHGVTPEVKEKLFLPYFSTKDRGTGLGLAIVSRIVEDHHGSIRVEENVPFGTRFIIELPVAHDAVLSDVAHA